MLTQGDFHSCNKSCNIISGTKVAWSAARCRSAFLALLIIAIAWPISGHTFELRRYGFNLGMNLSNVYGDDANDMGILFHANPDQISGWERGGDYWKYLDYDADSTIQAEPEISFGFAAGLHMTFEVTEYFLLRFDLNYTQRGAEWSKKLSLAETYGDEARQDLLLDTLPQIGFSVAGGTLEPGTRRYVMTNGWLDLPLFVIVAPIEEWHIMAGPKFSYFLHGSFERHRSQTSGTIEYENDVDASLVSETEVDFAVKPFDFGWVVGTSWLISDQVELGIRYSQGLMPIVDNAYEPDMKHWQLQLLGSFNFSRW